MKGNLDLGKRGEDVALEYLLARGMEFVCRNARAGHKEIDLIAIERNVLVFVEVKTRSNEFYGDVREAVTPRKMRNVILAAEAYMEHKKIDLPVRFDVVPVVPVGDTHIIEHIREAFYPELE